MVFFRCTVGGSGKGNTVTVTCAEEFAGLTITLSKTGKTYTKTCPSTAPYVVTFYGVENGTYTVSTTYEGETYSSEVTVQDISCMLHYGFNWKTWVDTASQLDSSDYDSLDEVLADEKALRELFHEHACVDYMASVAASNEDLETVINDDYCAKWINLSDYALDYLYANEIIADLMDEADKYFYGEWVITDDTTTPPTWGPKGNVPVMTSNTAPYGTASASSAYSGLDPWKAFDNNYSTGYGSNTGSASWLQYKFVNPICVRKFAFMGYQMGRFGSTLTLSASNDGTNFETLGTFTAENDDTKNQSFNVTNDNYYLYYRVSGNGSGYAGGGFRILQFYGRELKSLVGPLISNTSAKNGEAVYSSEFNSGYAAYKAFDGNPSTGWLAASGVTNNYVGFHFDEPTCIKFAKIRFAAAQQTKTFTIRACNDISNPTWVDLATITSANTSTDFYLDLNNNTKYSYYVAFCAESVHQSGSWSVQIGEFTMFGENFTEKEFEEGSTKKWLYDHGVELETLGISSQGGQIVTKNSDSFLVGSNSGAGFVLDLTPYSLARLQVGREVIESAYSAFMITASLASNTGEAQTRITDMPYNTALDISSFNDSKCVMVWMTTNNKAEVTEMWLE